MPRILRLFRAELGEILQWLVVHLPFGFLGSRARRAYWSARLRNDALAYVGFAARMHDCRLLRLGKGFVLGDYAALEVADSDPVYIGDEVAIANGTYLRSANHNFEDLSLPIRNQGHTSKRIDYRGAVYSIVIEDNVWIGAKCVILTGSFIGEGSVIAAGSVVSSAIPPFSIVAGNPARVVANRRKMAELKQAGSHEVKV